MERRRRLAKARAVFAVGAFAIALWVVLVTFGSSPGPGPGLGQPSPPTTPRHELVEEIHGHSVHDPYRWLEGEGNEVLEWVAQQDDHARAVLDASRHKDGFKRELDRMWNRDALVGPVQRRGERYFYARRHQGREKLVYYVRYGLDGPERTLIDPAELSSDGSLGVKQVIPNRAGTHVTYSVSRNAADEATLYVREVDTGRDLDDVILGARFAHPRWSPDGRAFYYTWIPEDPGVPPSKRAGYAMVRRHDLGRAPSEDPVLFGPTGDARTYLYPDLSADGRHLIVHLGHGSGGPTDIYVKRLDLDGPMRPLVVGNAERNVAIGYGGRIYLLTSDGAPKRRVMEIDPERPARRDWREVVAERSQVLEQVAIMNGHLVLSYLEDTHGRVRLQRLSDGHTWDVGLPDQGAVLGIWTDPNMQEVLIGFGSLASRPAIYRVSTPQDIGAATAPEVFWAPTDDPVEHDLVMEQIWVTSKDGTAVPVSVLHRRDLELDGTHPTILYGYGGFGISITPGYNPIAALWASRGGVWAQASIRGGGEFGEAWHRAGKRSGKQRVFDDFIAAAQGLIADGYTRADRLGIMGGSNGGLLVGAALTQRPELFGAVVCQVPLLDMVRYHRFGLGELWIDEYGSAEERAPFEILHAYSPYHHVRSDVAYPAMLMMSADTDDRVHPLHARKFVATLQHATAGRSPVLLRTEARAGHGGADSVDARVDWFADTLAFMLGELDPDYGRG